jgi:hypothetical protein
VNTVKPFLKRILQQEPTVFNNVHIYGENQVKSSYLNVSDQAVKPK